MIGWIILGIVVLFLLVLVIRAILFRPEKQEEKTYEAVEFDKDRAISALQTLVRFRTVSYTDHSLEDEAEFKKLIDSLPKLYPHVFETCEYQEMPDRGILFRWKGKSDGKNDPAVLMAHYDVVPVDPENWMKDPFGAEIENDVMWGRGTLDTKV
ncbi:MAG: M20/M25/M40 family metallo-hydrolase, partial [Lachnospiraceae bacterium]|nr:M20/M25/M40 family metallo-hydrolase [Lachnospiraceae bacterium]